jgi:hypothetical protein
MAKLPVKTIKDKLEALKYESEQRPYLGGSMIGHGCSRYVAYSFRWAYTDNIESKLWRIFRLGDAVEEILVGQLNKAGLEVYGQQVSVSGYKCHAAGHIDGLIQIDDVAHLFEGKSMNHTNYLDVQRKGVQVSKPIYYGQCQVYMGKLELKKALFLALDKNTSDVYIEILDFDQDEYDRLIRREEDVIDGLPISFFPKISNNPSWYSCKYCSARQVCHHGEMPAMNCRTCENSQIRDEGRWHCGWHNEEITTEHQREGCVDYQVDPVWTGGGGESSEMEY